MSELNNIKAVVNDTFKTNIDSKSRKRNNINAIKSFCYVSRKITNIPYQVIGRIIDRNHATVIHHIKDFESLMSQDKQLKEATEFILIKCNNMLGIDNPSYHENIYIYWDGFTIAQKKKLGTLALKFHFDNLKTRSANE